MISRKEIEDLLESKVNTLLEVKFKRVVRGGKMIRKRTVRKGFKLVRAKGGKQKIKRMTPKEKLNRHRALLRSWKKGKAARVIRSKRVMKRSMLKRKAIFGK